MTRRADTSGGICPSCDRYIGPSRACPYCGADSAQSPALHVIRCAALATATLGLALLYLTAVFKQPPTVRIGEITPTMNFAFVRVRGTVVRRPYTRCDRASPAESRVVFYLADSSGTLRVAAYGKVAAAICDANLVPGRGSPVEAAGNLNATADSDMPTLRLRSADHLDCPGTD